MTYIAKLSKQVILLFLIGTFYSCSDPVDDHPVDAGFDSGFKDSGSDASASDMADVKEEKTVFQSYEEMRDALREDPGYLRYEAKRLVKKADAEALRNLVRDRIQTIPAHRTSWDRSNQIVLGARGALRSGSGSMRDKAELLKDLLIEAGFDAEIRVYTKGPADFSARVLKAIDEPEFSIDEVKSKAWKKELGISSEYTPPILDADGSQLNKWKTRILAALPQDLEAEKFDFKTPSRIPIIRYKKKSESEWIHANLFLPDVAMGTIPGDGNKTISAIPLKESRPVKVELFLHRAGIKKPQLLVSQTYKSSELVGRQLALRTPVAGDPSDTLHQRIDSLSSFISLISLQGIDVDEALMEEKSTIGAAFTIRGKVIKRDEMGKIVVDGHRLENKKADLKQVTAIKVNANASNFPQVRLELDVITQSGILDSLPASSFKIKDQEKNVNWTLLQNKAKPLKILFITDASTSIPVEFREVGLSNLLKSIANDVLGIDTAAQFRVHKIGTSPILNSWTAEPADLNAQVSKGGIPFGSDIWTALSRSATTDPTVCIVISDGLASDEKTPLIVEGIRRLPPCVFLTVGESAGSILPEIAKLVSGDVFKVEDGETAKTRILEHSQERRFSYLGEYTSPDRSTGLHKVDVTLGDKTARVTYQADSLVEASGITGLELVVQRLPMAKTSRWLIGDGKTAIPVEKLQRELIETRTLSFEGQGVLAHERYDEILSGKLNHLPLYEALKSGDSELTKESLLKGARHLSAGTMALMQKLPSHSDHLIFQDGLRAVLLQNTSLSKDRAEQSIDLLNGSGFGLRSLNPDLKAAFRESIVSSLQLAMIEAETFTESTLKMLEGKDLVYLPPNTAVGTLLPDLTLAEKKAWVEVMRNVRSEHHVIPADGKVLAFFTINPKTGHMLAILPDQSGGARKAAELRKKRAQVISQLNWLGFGGNLAGAGVGFGFWLALGKAEAKQILTAAIAIEELDTPPPEDSITEAAAGVVCDVVKPGLIGSIPIIGGATNLGDSFSEAATGDPLFDCP